MTRDRIPSARIHAAVASQWGEDWLENEEVRTTLRFLSERALHRAFRENQYLSFDLADLILCKLDLVRLWLGPLEDIYSTVDLSGVPHSVRALPANLRRCDAVGCTNIFPRKRPNRYEQRFCCTQCQKNDWLRKQRGSRTLKERKYDACPSGHDRSPENVYMAPDGTMQCRVCTRIRKKERRRQLVAA